MIVGSLSFGHGPGLVREAVVFLPHAGFGDTVLDPEGDDGGEDADEEDRAPIGLWEDEAGEEGSGRVSDGPGGWADRDGPGAEFGGPGLGDEGGAGVPFAAHAKSENEAEDGEHEDRGGKARGEGA